MPRTTSHFSASKLFIKVATGFLTAVLASQSAHAGKLIDCEWPASVSAMVEPWAENIRMFNYGEDGIVRIAHMDTGGEPACCSSYLLILAPDPDDEMGNRTCMLLSNGDAGQGFTWVEFKKITAKEDKPKELLLTVPVQTYAANGGVPGTRKVRINRNSGAITLE